MTDSMSCFLAFAENARLFFTLIFATIASIVFAVQDFATNNTVFLIRNTPKKHTRNFFHTSSKKWKLTANEVNFSIPVSLLSRTTRHSHRSITHIQRKKHVQRDISEEMKKRLYQRLHQQPLLTTFYKKHLSAKFQVVRSKS